jgi:hypothetical protein
MAVIGGDITEITYNHPTLGSGVIYPKAAEDSTINPGGFRGNDDNNMVDGGGRNIRQLNRSRWSVETTVAWDNNVGLELEKMVALAGDPVEADWTITHISGTVWGGTGAPVGDMDGNGNQATFTLKISGGGKLNKLI